LIDNFPFLSDEGPGLRWQIEFGLGKNRGASFPSGHTHVMVGTATVLAEKFRKHAKLIMVVFCTAALSRVYVGVHYPLDILGGIVFGMLIAKGVLWIDSRKAHISKINPESTQ
jgi:undecaprenyl-diphosphatase